MDYAINMVGINEESSTEWGSGETKWELGFVPDQVLNSIIVIQDGNHLVRHDDYTIDLNVVTFTTPPERYTEIKEYLPSSIGINQASQIGFASGKDPLHVIGLQKLVQMLTKLILTNEGEDIVDPHIGGNLRKWAIEVPRYLQSDSGVYELASRVRDRVTQIVVFYQGDVRNLDEKLASLTVRSAYLDYENSRAVIEYNVTAESGDTAVFNLVNGGL